MNPTAASAHVTDIPMVADVPAAAGAAPATVAVTAAAITREGRSHIVRKPTSSMPEPTARARAISCSNVTTPTATTSGIGAPRARPLANSSRSLQRSATVSSRYPH
ncbi:hypothetical protein NY08_2025 [Rhodococcus sp. B7740]|nr:hypothetical protein NY08_2025 [Rhodococcus sp. B7740]